MTGSMRAKDAFWDADFKAPCTARRAATVIAVGEVSGKISSSRFSVILMCAKRTGNPKEGPGARAATTPFCIAERNIDQVSCGGKGERCSLVMGSPSFVSVGWLIVRWFPSGSGIL